MHQAYEQSLRRAIVQSGVINDTCTFHVSKALFILFIMRVSSAYIFACIKIEYMCGFIMILPDLMIINLVFYETDSFSQWLL